MTMVKNCLLFETFNIDVGTIISLCHPYWSALKAGFICVCLGGGVDNADGLHKHFTCRESLVGLTLKANMM